MPRTSGTTSANDIKRMEDENVIKFANFGYSERAKKESS